MVRRARSAFTLIELLVVIAVVGVMISLLLPALARARAAGRSVVCLSNLRQCHVAIRAYADENRGVSPALGQPYLTLPNWALVVQSTWLAGETPGELYHERSVLVCPLVRAAYGTQMTRTCAINATGLSGQAGPPPDRANYDDTNVGAYVKLDAVATPSDIPLLVDAAAAVIPPPAPPPTRCASVLDFRLPDHREQRLGRFHGGGRFGRVMFDGSARTERDIPDAWLMPLP